MLKSAEVEAIAQSEREITGPGGTGQWNRFDSGPEMLGRIFKDSLDGLGFKSLREAADHLQGEAPNRPVTGLELAGQGNTFDEFMVPGVAVSLAFPDYLTEITENGPHRRGANASVVFVPGDIAQEATWNQIERRLMTEQIPKPNFVLFAPGDLGLMCMPDKADFFLGIMRRVMDLTDGGPLVFLGEVRKNIQTDLGLSLGGELKAWGARIDFSPGLVLSRFAISR